jgi:hypothetical protein
MRNLWKWILGIVGGLLVLGLIASAFFLRFALPMMAGRGVVAPRAFQGTGPQRVPRMFGGMGGFGRFGPMGFGRGGMMMFLPHLLWQLVLLALVVAGVIFLVRAISKPRVVQVAAVSPGSPAGPVVQPAVIAPTPFETAAVAAAPLKTCASCGRELQNEWNHCPYCGAKVETGA